MRCTALNSLNSKSITRAWLGLLLFVSMLAGAPAFAADVSASAETAVASNATLTGAEPIVSTKPVELTADEGGAHGQLFTAPEILSADAGNELVYTITREPLHGRVGLAGGD